MANCIEVAPAMDEMEKADAGELQSYCSSVLPGWAHLGSKSARADFDRAKIPEARPRRSRFPPSL
jgi:hypothetical protein